MDRIVSTGIQVLIPPDSGTRKGTRPGWDGGAYAFMRRVLSTDHGAGLYARRKQMIEPVFGDTKFNRGIDRFHRRGRAAAARGMAADRPPPTTSSSSGGTPPPPRPPETDRRPARPALSSTTFPLKRLTHDAHYGAGAISPFTRQPQADAVLGIFRGEQPAIRRAPQCSSRGSGFIFWRAAGSGRPARSGATGVTVRRVRRPRWRGGFVARRAGEERRVDIVGLAVDGRTGELRHARVPGVHGGKSSVGAETASRRANCCGASVMSSAPRLDCSCSTVRAPISVEVPQRQSTSTRRPSPRERLLARWPRRTTRR